MLTNIVIAGRPAPPLLLTPRPRVARTDTTEWLQRTISSTHLASLKHRLTHYTIQPRQYHPASTKRSITLLWGCCQTRPRNPSASTASKPQRNVLARQSDNALESDAGSAAQRPNSERSLTNATVTEEGDFGCWKRLKSLEIINDLDTFATARSTDH